MREFSQRILLVLVVGLTLAGAGAVFGADAPGVPVLPWLDGFSLVVLDTGDVSAMHQARNLIQSFGGQIAIMSPPSLMMGWIPFEVRDQLVGRAGIKDIYYTEVLPGEVEERDEQTRMMIAYYNAVARGDIQNDYRMRQDRAAAQGEEHHMMPDVLDPPAFDKETYLENLHRAGLDPAALEDRGLILEKSGEIATGNSDKMTGTVAVTVFFVESNGSGADPNLYTWTAQHMQDYLNGVNNGLAWWSSEARDYSGCWVAFLVHYVPATDSRCQQWYEPILHPSTDETNWVGLVMNNFGYTSGTTATKVNSFNTWQRSAYGTDRAYSAFVAYNPPPASDRFTNGYAAATYWGGPYAYLLYRSFDWTVEEVFAHETGHIFFACDEYYQPGYGGCSGCGVCYNGVINGNCEKDGCGPGKSCMMKDNSFNLCQYTPGHVGWLTSPCAPTPLAAPVILSCSPDAQYQGFDETLTITGSNFVWGAFVDLGPGIVVKSTNFISSMAFMATITISNSAAAGLRDVVVYNRDLQSDTLFAAFEVKNTTRHYLSLDGGDVYPYSLPENAARSLADAIAVANTGDSVFVASGTFDNATVQLSRGIALFGGWNRDFTERDLAGGKTVLNLNGDISINPGANLAVLDGFIVQDGDGAYQAVPFAAYFGGGIRIINGQAAVANCEIRSNAASPGIYDVGIGGGIFAMNSTVSIHDNYIWNNSAWKGGGVYLYACAGSVERNTISNNHVAAQTSSEANGGGIYLNASSGLILGDNVIEDQTGANQGGGLYVGQSNGITVTGGVVTRNQASWAGAGVYIKQSSVVFDGTELLRNSSSIFGGALAVESGSVLTLNNASLMWNTGPIGGAVYASGGTCHVDHCLFVGNYGSSGGAVYMSAVSTGSVLGNTIDRTRAEGTGSAVLIATSNVAFMNNIISNTLGYGISASGSPPLEPRYNDVWNNSAAGYSGCTPLEGSISADPLFADTVQADYRLTVHSPAIDAAYPSAGYNDPDGSRGDLGVFGSHPFSMAQPSYPKALEQSVMGGKTILTWEKNPEPDVEYYAVYRDTIQEFTPALLNFVQFVSAADTNFSETFQEGRYYRISAVDSMLYGSGYSDAVMPDATAVGDGPLSFRFELRQNTPNPFNPITMISYEIDRAGFVSLAVYDVAGRLVKRLVNERRDAGSYREQWNGTSETGGSVASGVYFCRLKAGDHVKTMKMILLR
jgi:hypothetical protein